MNGSLFIGDKGRIAIEHDKHPEAAARGQVRRLQRPRAVPAQVARPSPAVDRGLQDRQPHRQQLCSMPGRSPRSCCWATSPTASARRSNFDPAAMKVTNVPEANEYLSKSYRKGWEILSNLKTLPQSIRRSRHDRPASPRVALQFSLRTVLIVLTLVAIAGWWWQKRFG